jgi:site-specific recombinase XerD
MECEILDYLQRIRPRVAAATYKRKSWMVQAYARYLGTLRGGKNIATAKRADVEAFLLSLDAGQQFRQAVCCTIRELYDTMRHPDNPAAKIEFKPDHSRRLPQVPSQATIAEIIARLSDNGSDLRIRDRLMVELAYGSGLRRDELHRLNIEDIDLESGTAYVTGKGDKCRTVPLTAKTAETIRRYLTHRTATRGPLLLSYTGRRLSCNSVYTVMRTRAGIRPHLLRHACATHMLANGCGVRVIGELLGHADLASTQIYTTIEKGDLARIVNEKHPRKTTV